MRSPAKRAWRLNIIKPPAPYRTTRPVPAVSGHSRVPQGTSSPATAVSAYHEGLLVGFATGVALCLLIGYHLVQLGRRHLGG